MKKEDIDAVQKLLNNYLNKFEVAPVFSREDVEHWLIPRDEVIFSYVVEVPFNAIIKEKYKNIEY